MENFGEHIKTLRIEKRIGLRKFCKSLNIDPSNWSRIERGLANPPKSITVIKEIADTLNIGEGTEEYNTMVDLAMIGAIPKQFMTEQKLMDSLPVFFRTVRGDKPTEEELNNLIDILKSEY